MVKKIFAVVGSALLFLLIIGASSAADIDINNDGTFSDVQNGINQAQSGDTIYLNNHTFTGSGSEISVAGGWFSNKDKITIDGSIILFWKTVLSVTVKHHLAQEEMFILHYIQKIQ